jgi:hypothetical protein
MKMLYEDAIREDEDGGPPNKFYAKCSHEALGDVRRYWTSRGYVVERVYTEPVTLVHHFIIEKYKLRYV